MLYDQFERPIGYVSTIWLAGETFYFLDADSNIRIKNGKLQLKDDVEGKWFNLLIQTDQGIRTIVLSDTGESS